MDSPRIQRALISVSDKLGLADFARGLIAAGIEIFSTGGTRKHLETEGIPVRDVSEYTGFPEMMDGRLKTLHPKVHGGILCRHDNPEDMRALAEHGILTFELVVVNLYPFEATVARKDVAYDEAIEKIDIGGPTLVRAASKNHAFTTIATDASQYSEILEQITAHGCTTLDLRRRLAGEAFAHTARYDQAIAEFFAGENRVGPFSGAVTTRFTRKTVLRYGENPHQQAALYAQSGASGANIVSARQLNGKELSYNNLLDLDSALGIVRQFADPAAVVVKHNNPCGAAVAATLAEALQRAMEGDPLSAFGSVLGLNRDVDDATAEVLSAPGLFVEAIVAPRFDPVALRILTTKPKWRNNVRLMEVGQLGPSPVHWVFRYLDGGALMQEADVLPDPENLWHVVTETQPTDAQSADLRFAWEMVRHVKSNAIVLCKGQMLLGAGAGQMSRVDSTEIAIKKAGARVEGSVLASDAFFPFPDSIERAAAAGVAAIIQPGGSKNDPAVLQACNQFHLPMIFTGRRHFKH
ncbi:MAG: bifunctional phosphoribosylaminoimidazolecarboxamide formyltransferase/IMP cyclohydrolase [Planctomycetaceae bacterium]|nr:bifunctional phosphoribosylaminoimidazolecarboxamide formyltransferase/IMP cyclohydrolase [Planctomycetaceae bacterium]